MFNINEIVAKIEGTNRNHRWQGGGQGNNAVLCGFKRPADDDECGVWTHPEAGCFEDDRMPAVVDLVMLNQVARMGEPDLQCGLSRLGQFLELFQKRVDIALEMDTAAPDALVDHAIAIAKLLEDAQRLIRHVTFEGDQ